MARVKITAKTETEKQFISIFDSLCRYQSSLKAWADFIEVSAIALANSCDKSLMRDKREKRYLDIMASYKQDGEKFGDLYGLLVMALTENQEQDFLGSMFMQLNLGNHWKGQFFTAYSVSRMMAQMQVETIINSTNEKGWTSIHDCACGAGALLIAVRNAMMLKNIDWSSKALFVAQDIDHIAGLMCYVQLSLLGCAGYVVIGDTLSNPVTGMLLHPKADDIWYMPTLYLNPVWAWRMIAEGVK